jgi:hypothetical protein
MTTVAWTFWMIDFFGALYLRVGGEVYNNKILSGLGFIIVLTCLWVLRKLRNDSEAV